MYERRVEPRTNVEVSVWMEGGSTRLLPCTLTNLSLRGGEVVLPPEVAIPKQFAIRLTKDGKIRRGCHVRWREGARVGVSFFRLVETDTRHPVLV
jgi:hypothetical protein